MTKKLDWKDLKAAFLNLSDEQWKVLAEEDQYYFYDEVLLLEEEDFFGTEGMNNRFG